MMKELTIHERKHVSGGIIPCIIGGFNGYKGNGFSDTALYGTVAGMLTSALFIYASMPSNYPQQQMIVIGGLCMLVSGACGAIESSLGYAAGYYAATFKS